MPSLEGMIEKAAVTVYYYALKTSNMMPSHPMGYDICAITFSVDKMTGTVM